MTSHEVIAAARDWIGTPWRHQGRSRQGVDCIGLLVVVARGFGLEVLDRTDYARDPSSVELLTHLRRHLRFVYPGENGLGAVGIFRQARLVCHVGILAERDGAPSVIHARMDMRQVVEHPIVAEGRDMALVEVGAFPGLTP